MATYKILSLDGGGIRGLVTTSILKQLDEALPGWFDQVDLVAGTSTGGIIALALASGLTVSEIRSLYYDNGSVIFDDSWLDNLLDLGQVSGANYDNKNLRNEVKKIWGDTKLKDLSKKVLVSSFDLDNEDPDPRRRTWKPKFFHNFSGQDCDGEMAVYLIALYTSAAPTYFPTIDGYVDGGVVANNPSMAALTQVLDSRARIKERPALAEIVLLSVGTGQSPYFIKGDRLDWGFAQWARPIISLMMDGNMGVADYQCQQLLGQHYHRVSPTLTTSIPLDDWRKRDELEAVVHDTNLAATIKWLKTYWM
jgi:patatin-like phospholipase/acyl hydrolase